MALSVPISVLKAKAKQLKRTEGIGLAAALDRVARQEGYASWTLLMRHMASPPKTLWERSAAGELVVLAARRGEGKTICALQAVLAAARSGRKSWFFTLDNDIGSEESLFARAGVAGRGRVDLAEFDRSDEICADYVIDRVAGDAAERSVIVVDYLQALAHRGTAAPVRKQVEALRQFARSSGSVVVFISQLKRRSGVSSKRFPGPRDLRLPNPADVGLFDKALFLHGGQSRLRSVGTSGTGP